MDSLTGPAVACQACQHSGDKARLKFHRGNPTPQLTIVKWFNKRRAVGTHHTGTTTGFLSSLWSPVLPQQSWHLAAASSVVFSPRWPKPKLFHSIHAGGYSAYLSHRRFNAQCSHERTPEFLSALQPTSSEISWIQNLQLPRGLCWRHRSTAQGRPPEVRALLVLPACVGKSTGEFR